MVTNLTKRILRKTKRLFIRPEPEKKLNPDDTFYIDFLSKLPSFKEKLNAAKKSIVFSSPDLYWHPFEILAILSVFDTLLTGNNRNLRRLSDSLPIADIGAADGDLSFFLESCGLQDIHILEYSPTSCNRMEGARMLKKALQSAVTIHEFNIDSGADLPCRQFGLVLLLGTLYHIKNPFQIMEKLASYSRYCLLSTRITRFAPDGKTNLSKIPCAYLLDKCECNNDSTNYWVFTESGLKRMVERAGWNILDFAIFGSKFASPASMEHSQRAFCLLKSNLKV